MEQGWAGGDPVSISSATPKCINSCLSFGKTAPKPGMRGLWDRGHRHSSPPGEGDAKCWEML